MVVATPSLVSSKNPILSFLKKKVIYQGSRIKVSQILDQLVESLLAENSGPKIDHNLFGQFSNGINTFSRVAIVKTAMNDVDSGLKHEDYMQLKKLAASCIKVSAFFHNNAGLSVGDVETVETILSEVRHLCQGAVKWESRVGQKRTGLSNRNLALDLLCEPMEFDNKQITFAEALKTLHKFFISNVGPDSNDPSGSLKIARVFDGFLKSLQSLAAKGSELEALFGTPKITDRINISWFPLSRKNCLRMFGDNPQNRELLYKELLTDVFDKLEALALEGGKRGALRGSRPSLS